MAARSRKAQPAAPSPAGTGGDQPATPDQAASAEQTSDYRRRAGGYVLTDRGWVREEQDGE